jgi:16S rRNA (cytidine1402-2'-O)-methyltransferase
MPTVKKEFKVNPGTLYLVATPIGNLGDITGRALETLSQVDYILCEDTRNSGKLLKVFGIKQKLTSFHQHNESEKTDWVITNLSEGKTFALISNAGSPLICDPGNLLVRTCIENGLKVEVIPGPTAYTTAMLLSGFLEKGFHFAGWIPRKGKEREEALYYISTINEPVAIYESLKRVGKTLADFANIQPERPAVVARELTKLHEEILRGTCRSLADELKGKELKGECVIVLGPAGEDSIFDRAKTDMVYNYFTLMKREGIPTRKAAKLAAKLLGLPANDVYRLLVIEDEVK